MQAARLGAASWCLIVVAAAGHLLQAPSVHGQTSIETQQQANERIRQLSISTPTPAHDYVIGRGDLIGVEVFEIPELTRDLRVSQTGTVGLPLVRARLFVAGLTEMQAQQKIAEVLEANGLIAHPQVMVSVKEKRSKPITVVGAVAHPMVYQADRPVTLVQVLAEAGGISTDAGDTIIVTRTETGDASSSNEPPEIGAEDATPVANPAPPAADPAPQTEQSRKNPEVTEPGAFPGPETATASTTQNAGAAPPAITASDAAPLAGNTITVNLAELLERGNTQNNIALQGGDIVTVPHAGVVYALGAVNHPGGFVASNDRAQLSTLKVLALAGGMTRVAKRGQAVIIRKDTLGKQQAIPVDLGSIIQRKSEDVQLKPSDILYVPDSETKAALLRAGEIGLALGTALTIYRIGTR
jgi:protein involved in polysaccharide export with SLBB domain